MTVKRLPALFRALGWVLVTLLVVMLLAFLAVRHWVLPAISANPAWVLDPVQRSVGMSVQVQTWEWSWKGLHPRLQTQGLRIAPAHNEAAALRVQQIEGVLAWKSLLRLEPRFSQLTIAAPQVRLRRLADGRWAVADHILESNHDGDAPLLRWLADQGEIQLKAGRLTLIDDTGELPDQHLTGVQIQVRNAGRRHRFQLAAHLPDGVGQSIELRGDFREARFRRAKTRLGDWSGTLFLEAQHLALARLGAWLPASEWPRALDGQVSLRLWGDWQQGRWASGQLDLQGQSLGWQANQSSALRLRQAQARLSYANADQQHYLTLQQLKLEPEQGASFAPSQGSMHWRSDAKDGPNQVDVSVQGFLLEALQPWVQSLALEADQKQLLQDIDPRGQIKHLALKATRQGAGWQAQSLHVDFEQLVLRPDKHDPQASGDDPGRPGVNNVRGSLHWTPRESRVDLDAAALTLAFPRLFEDPLIRLDRLRGQTVIETPEAGPVRVHFKQFSLANADVEAQFDGVWTTQGQSSAGSLALQGTASRASAQQIHRYLPLSVDADARRWVREAVKAGQLSETTFQLEGDLDRFPFAGSTTEVFRIESGLRSGRLNLVPPYWAEGALWPDARQLKGLLTFDQDRIRAEIQGGQIGRDSLAWLPVQGSQVRIDDLDNDPVLQVQGVVAAEADQVLKLVQQTSLNALTDEQLSESRGTGRVRIPLTLRMPLNDVSATQVQGRVVLKQNRFQYLPVLPMVEQLSGELAFDERGIRSDGIRGHFQGLPVMMRAQQEGGGNSRIEVEGRIDRTALAAWLPSPLWQQVSGATPYRVEIEAEQHQPARVRVSSSLQGMALALPAPLHKPAETRLPLSVEWVMPAAAQTERWTATLGKAVHAIWERYPETPARDRAIIAMGAPAELGETGLHLIAKSDALNLDPWLALLGQFTRPPQADDKTEALAGPVGAEVVEQLPQVRSIQLQTPRLQLDGQAWHGLDLHATYDTGPEGESWSVSVSADEAEGVLSWQAAQAFGKPARLFARLDRLRITDEMSKRDQEKAAQGDTEGLVPEVDIVVKRFYFRDQHLGRLELQAHHDVQQRAWQLQTISLQHPEGSLQGQGMWRSAHDNRSALPVMSLDAEYQMNDIGGTLKRYGFADAIEGGKGGLKVRLGWQGLPYSLDIPSLTGQVELDVDQGRFLKVEPGAAKLLNMLSLQALPRRVSLDFSDVFSQGFAFDSIRGRVDITKGVARTDSLKMIGPSATVMMAGETDLHHETQALRAVVIPQLDAGAASLLYGAVVNPAIGLGVFLAQWLMQNQLSSVLTYQYDVSGSWQDPTIVKVPRSTGTHFQEVTP